MPDVFTKRGRSEVMSLIRGSGNKGTELRLIQIFRINIITGWRRSSKLPGKPDFVFQKLKTAVFVDGCFWHGCPKHGTKPKTNAAFWRRKIARNRARDVEVGRALRRLGWRVLRIWEHELPSSLGPMARPASRRKEQRLLARLRRALGEAA
jgi:DNA mismatch endonuclease (patch repair protein)